MTRTRLSAGRLACALLASTAPFAVAMPASAQLADPAPVRETVDANGVDLFRGNLVVKSPTLTMGGQENGVSFYKVSRGAGWEDNLVAAINKSGSVVTVNFGGKSDRFNLLNGAYTGTEGLGSKLTYDSTANLYTYTARDGTTVIFDRSKSSDAPYKSNEGRALSITTPDGASYSYAYESQQYCSSYYQLANGYGCYNNAVKTIHRVSYLQNDYGYRIGLSYELDDYFYDSTAPEAQPNLYQWSKVVGAVATNRAAPNDSNQRSISFADVPGVPSYVNVTDTHGVTKYRMNGNTVMGITLPGSASENISVAYSNGKVSSVTNRGVTTGYAYADANGFRTTTITNALNQPTAYKFEIASERLKEVTDPLNKKVMAAHDSNGRVTRVTQPEGNYTEYTYDDRGNVIKTRKVAKPGSGIADIVTEAGYDSSPCTNTIKCNQPNWTRDAKGNQTDYSYDPTTNLLKSVTAPGPTGAPGEVRPETRYSYTAVRATYRDQINTWVQGDPMWKMTGISRCQTQNATACVGTADEVRTVIDYGPQTTTAGNNLHVVSSATGNGNNTLTAPSSATYDDVGNLLTVDGPLAGAADTTRYRYDEARQLRGVISPDPDGTGSLKHRAVKFQYDSWGQVTHTYVGTVTDQSDAAWSNFSEAYRSYSTFDGNGRRLRDHVWSNNAHYSVQDYVYDGLGRVSCTVTKMNPASWGAQATTCSPQQTTGPNGPDRVVQAIYNASGQVTEVKQNSSGATLETERKMLYRDNGTLQYLYDGENNVTEYQYDGFDRLIKTVLPSTAKGSGNLNTADYEQFTYDANGNVTAKRLRSGHTVTLYYDNLNRVYYKARPLAGEAGVNYAYDLLGRTTAISAGAWNLNYAYDALGRQTAESQGYNSTVRQLTRQYDLAGRLTRTAWWDGVYVDYVRLVTGELSQVWANSPPAFSLVASYSYDDLGRRTYLTRGNNRVTAYTYDSVSRLTNLIHDMGNTAYDVTIGSMTYNPAGQITGQTRSNDAYAWPDHFPIDRTYTSNGLNQYTQASAPGFTTATYSYGDGRGNLTADGTSSYTYDSENKLTQVQTGATTRGLSYDPAGRLAAYDNALATKWFVYDGAEAVAEVDTSGNITRRYIRGDGADEIILEYVGNGIGDPRYHHQDERGSTIAWSNAAGNMDAILSYDEYGNPKSSNPGRFQYTGQMYLPEIGLYNYKARMYSPGLGRFMQADPIGYGDGMNMYAYVGNDSINGTDPSGMTCQFTGPPSQAEIAACQAGEAEQWANYNPGPSFDSFYGASLTAASDMIGATMSSTAPAWAGENPFDSTQPGVTRDQRVESYLLSLGLPSTAAGTGSSYTDSNGTEVITGVRTPVPTSHGQIMSFAITSTSRFPELTFGAVAGNTNQRRRPRPRSWRSGMNPSCSIGGGYCAPLGRNRLPIRPVMDRYTCAGLVAVFGTGLTMLTAGTDAAVAVIFGSGAAGMTCG